MDLIAIDGLAGTGKSTLAASLSKRCGLAHLDTGATFRMMAWAVLESGADPSSETEVMSVALRTTIEYEGGCSRVDGRDVTALIRSQKVGQAASQLAVHPALRSFLLRWQRDWVASHGRSVVEGRDIASVVFPDAALKVFLQADSKVRAYRRNESSETELAERDMRDASRPIAPMVKTQDAVVIDTGRVTVPKATDFLAGLWKERTGSRSEPMESSDGS